MSILRVLHRKPNLTTLMVVASTAIVMVANIAIYQSVEIEARQTVFIIIQHDTAVCLGYVLADSKSHCQFCLRPV